MKGRQLYAYFINENRIILTLTLNNILKQLANFK